MCWQLDSLEELPFQVDQKMGSSPGPGRLRRRSGLGVLALFAVCSAGLMHDWLL